MSRLGRFALLTTTAIAGCSEPPPPNLAASSDGAWALVASIDVLADSEVNATTIGALLERRPDIDFVIAHDLGLARRAAMALGSHGHRARIVTIGDMRGPVLEALESGIVDAAVDDPTHAEDALDLAVLACLGARAPQSDFSLGTVSLRPENATFGGITAPTDDDGSLDDYRALHTELIDHSRGARTLRVGISVRSLRSDWQQRFRNAIDDRARSLVVDVELLEADEAIGQRSAIERLAQRGIDALVLVTGDEDVARHAAEVLGDRPLVIAGPPVGGLAHALGVHTPARAIGAASGRLCRELVRSARIVELRPALDRARAEGISEGLRDALALDLPAAQPGR
ncbi:MAG: hypothetical protein KDB80_10965 [Planctomycetes bacterium]|nr:hypothetical protein [Planctomycetota bacterium]